MTSASRHAGTTVFPFRATLFLAASALCSAQLYTITTVAGGAPPSITASTASTAIRNTIGIAADPAGNVWFTADNCVFKLDPRGALTRVAGNSRAGYSGDGGPAIEARLEFPIGVAVDSSGNLFIADSGNSRIRKVSPDGIITTVAGNGVPGASGDGGPAADSPLLKPTSIAVDAAGVLYIGEDDYLLYRGATTSRVRKVSTDGIIHSVAVKLPINGVRGVAVDRTGNLFIADWGNSRVLQISPYGSSIIAAGGGLNWPGDGGSATAARLIRPASVAADSAGNLFIGDAGQIQQAGYLASVRKVSPGGIITTLAGGGRIYPPAPAVPLSGATGMATDAAGNLFVADFRGILEISGNATPVRVAGSDFPFTPPPADGSLATSVQLQLGGVSGVAWQSYLALDPAGNLYVSENALHRVRKVSLGGTITTVAGTGTSGFFGDGGPATAAQLSYPAALAVNASGDLFIADSDGSRIRKVSANGVITTVAAGISSISGMAADNSGNLFLADIIRYQVWKLSTTGTLATLTVVAGTGERGFSGDGGLATSAQLSYLTGLAVDAAGNLYLADNDRIRRVSTEGTITTVAGGGPDPIGNGVPANTAQLGSGALAIDKTGNLFLAESSGNRVREISTDGIVTTIAGNGNTGYSGDGGPATSAQMRVPSGIAVDHAGRVYVADTFNNAIRILQPTNQVVMVGAIVDAASESIRPISPGKIAILYGAGLGPSQLTHSQPNQSGVIDTQLAGTSVLFNGVSAPVLYSSATQVAVIAPYAVSGDTASVIVTYQGQISAPFRVPLAAASPAIFTLNQTGAGQAAAVNLDGTTNNAANPVKIGGTISLYATGEGQTSPAGVDGKLATAPLPQPVLPVTVTIDGQRANVTYYGAAPGQVAGLMQVNVQIPNGVRPGGYVPLVLQVGTALSQPGLTIAVSLN